MKILDQTEGFYDSIHTRNQNWGHHLLPSLALTHSLPVWWMVFSDSPPPCWSHWFGWPLWWSRCIPCTETSYTGVSGTSCRNRKNSRAGRSTGRSKTTCSQNKKQIQENVGMKLSSCKCSEFGCYFCQINRQQSRLNITTKWTPLKITHRPTQTHRHTHTHMPIMLFPTEEISWHLSYWERLCLLMTRLAAITGIHGVSSSEWFPISQSVPGNKKLSLGVIAFSWNSKEKSTRATWSWEDACRRDLILNQFMEAVSKGKLFQLFSTCNTSQDPSVWFYENLSGVKSWSTCLDFYTIKLNNEYFISCELRTLRMSKESAPSSGSPESLVCCKAQ